MLFVRADTGEGVEVAPSPKRAAPALDGEDLNLLRGRIAAALQSGGLSLGSLALLFNCGRTKIKTDLAAYRASGGPV